MGLAAGGEASADSGSRGANPFVAMIASVEALTSLRGVDELMRHAPWALCEHPPFERALIWRVVRDRLVPRGAASIERADADFLGRVQRPVRFSDGSPESRALQGESVVIVHGPTTWRNPFSAVAAHCYLVVAVEIERGSRWLLHADAGAVDDSSEDFVGGLLWCFAEGLRFAARIVSLRERLALQQEELRRFVAGISSDSPLLPPAADSEVHHGPSGSAEELGRARGLSLRERQVLEHLAAGESNSAIAEHLVVTEATVKSHIRSLLRKLGVSNRVEAIAMLHPLRDEESPDAGGHSP